MRRRENIRRRAFLDGYRAGRRHNDRERRELTAWVDGELKRFADACEAREKDFKQTLAAATRAALHRLQGPEDAAVDPPRWLQ